ncbi:MAG: valine--tRNA ligase, partial [Firmicutes bacterium]|nr:valine--tRNA ligase [Bacillota bacterium]
MRKELDKTYDPAQVEKRIYQFWLDGGYFHAEVNPEKKPFTIVIPPPNITGKLHMGHALDNTIQDILIRMKRMQGYEALWMPGTDHASIATEVKIVENMRAEGLSKDDVGRDGFLERAWDWKKNYGGTIVKQLKTLGCSCDWERERFTLDEGCSKAVRKVFAELYNKGLIYRGERIINWCPKCGTSISDAEVEYEDQAGHFWHLRYPLTDGSGWLELATTRPETLLGDTAVAVNPKDERYTSYIGKTVTLPLVGREIPVVADEYVDMEFGTGVVKITPAHDPNDFEVGLRHNLPQVEVIDLDAKMTAACGEKYAGMDRYECRKAMLAELKELGLGGDEEVHVHAVGHCYRCGTTVEPLISKQWFLKMAPLAEPAIAAVKEGETSFVPSRFDKVYLGWMENIRDWCISRQLWWGHRIPVWYCDDCGAEICVREDPEICPKCGSKHIHQDEDVLDTWFSSAMWPYSTLGWPDKTPEMEKYFPNSVLVTGWDIIFFWVARMIFSSLFHTGKAPFKEVLIHGLVLDAQGRKMSKSLGNGIDPLKIIDTHGADSLRFMLVTGNTPGNNLRFREERLEGARNFANKIWNASRFVLMNTETRETIDESKLQLPDKWILSRLNKVIEEISGHMEDGDFGIAAQNIYDFAWNEFCDWYIELSKGRL